MPKILTVRSRYKGNSYNENILQKLWSWFVSLDGFVKYSFIILLCVVAGAIGWKGIYSLFTHAATPPLTHFFGGFSIDTAEEIATASSQMGMQVDMKYGTPYTSFSGTPQYSALVSSNMKEIDGQLWKYLYYYECQKLGTCAVVYPELTSVTALMSDITAHLQSVQNESEIVEYWILDDWPLTDPGSAQTILQQITSLVHQYTPNKPTICGFGAQIYPLNNPYYHPYSWSDGLAANFSPTGCDMIDFYIYAEGNIQGTNTIDSYDWTMSQLIPVMETSLENRGWNIAMTPLIGTPQGFGGLINGVTTVVPSASSVETQTKSFCQFGATGILYYTWDSVGTTSTSKYPWNDTDIIQGISQGKADCNSIWGANSTPTATPTLAPTVSPTPTPGQAAPTPTPTVADTTPPSVSVTSPAGGKVAKHSTIQITASATDDTSVAQVQFLVNGSVICTDTAAPYSCSWSVPGKPGANYTLTAKATDAAGYYTISAPVNVSAQ